MDMEQFIDLLTFQMKDSIAEYLKDRPYVTKDIETEDCQRNIHNDALEYNGTNFVSLGSDEFTMNYPDIEERFNRTSPLQLARNVLNDVLYSLKVNEDLYMQKTQSPMLYQLRKPKFSYMVDRGILRLSAYEIIGAR